MDKLLFYFQIFTQPFIFIEQTNLS